MDSISVIVREEVSAIVPTLVEEVAKVVAEGVKPVETGNITEEHKKLWSQLFQENNAKLEKQTTKAIRASIKTTNELVKGVTSETSGTITQELSTKMDRDIHERSSRANNVVIFNIEESTKAKGEDREADDMKFAVEVLGLQERKIRKIYRAGKKYVEIRGQQITKNKRPMIIRMIDAKYAEFLHDGGKGYRTNSGHYINKDLCRADREAHRKAREWRTGRTKEIDDSKEPCYDDMPPLEKRQKPQKAVSDAISVTEDVADVGTEDVPDIVVESVCDITTEDVSDSEDTFLDAEKDFQM